jgi:hypothetical protein
MVLLDYSFAETLSDTARYDYYRNYFSGGEAFGSSIASSYSKNSRLINRKGKPFFEETETSERFVRPSYLHSELFDQRGLTEEAKKILSEEFTKQAKELVMREINIDTMKLVHTAGDIYTTNKEKSHSESFGKINTIEKGYLTYNLASTDSISKKSFDFIVKHEGNPENLSVEEKRAGTLEEILVFRLSAQQEFNRVVHFDDKVYVVRFRYHGAIYKDYFICNPETKKVVMEYFFKNITIQTRK